MNPLDPTRRTNVIPKARKCPETGKPLCRWCSKPVPSGRRSWCSQECVDDALIRCQPGYARKAVGERDKGVCSKCGLDTRALKNHLRNIGALALNGLIAYDRTKARACARYEIKPDRLYYVCTARQTSFEQATEEEKRTDLNLRSIRGWEPIILEITRSEHLIRIRHFRLMKLATARLKRLYRELSSAGFDGISSRNGTVSRSMWDADHIVPVVKGGGGCGLDNYRTLCQPCHKGETAALAAERALARKGPQPPPHPELNL